MFNVKLFSYLFCLFLFLIHKTDVSEDLSFATKLTDLSNFEDESEHGYPDLEIFQVKYLGTTTIHAAKSVQATSNAIKSIIATAKGE